MLLTSNMGSSLLQYTLFILGLVSSASAGEAQLPAYPLAVRSPYLSAWLSRDFAADFPTAVTQFWHGQKLGWEVMARVNGQAYSLFGVPQPPEDVVAGKQTAVTYTSTHTIVNITADTVDFTLDFFSPVDPTNLLRQSLPFSYLTVTALSKTSSSPTVQLYSAIDDAWAGDVGAVTADLTSSGGASMYIVSNKQDIPYTENEEMAAWGDVVYATLPSDPSKLSYYCAAPAQARTVFASGGSAFSKAASSACGSQQNYAFQYDYGNLANGAAVSSTFAIGQSRDLVVNYLGHDRTGYASATYPTTAEAATAFLKDLEGAYTSSVQLDNLVRQQGDVVSSNYADILEASVRQSYGTLEITIDQQTKDSSDPLIFWKEISSDGNVNTIDYMYQSSVLFYMLDPTYIKLSMEPVLRYLTSTGPRWVDNFLLHDLGSHYPNATGHDDNLIPFTKKNRPEYLPLDSTSDGLALVYMYQHATGDQSWAQKYESLLTTYADYLAANYTASDEQLSSVDALPPPVNETTLTVTSAISLNAFAQTFNKTQYAQKAAAIVTEYYSQGKGLSKDRSHFTYQNGREEYDDSWAVMYPLYIDTLLHLHTFPQSASDLMSTFYSKNIHEYGLVYTNTVDWGITDWNMWVGALAPEPLQQQVVDATYRFLVNPVNQKPFQTKYGVLGKEAGQAIANIARGTVSSNFAILALNQGTWFNRTRTGLSQPSGTAAPLHTPAATGRPSATGRPKVVAHKSAGTSVTANSSRYCVLAVLQVLVVSSCLLLLR